MHFYIIRLLLLSSLCWKILPAPRVTTRETRTITLATTGRTRAITRAPRIITRGTRAITLATTRTTNAITRAPRIIMPGTRAITLATTRTTRAITRAPRIITHAPRAITRTSRAITRALRNITRPPRATKNKTRSITHATRAITRAPRIIKRTTHSIKQLPYNKVMRIIGGKDAERNLAPYIVSLQINRIHLCGGAILANRWIVTAAHCVKEKKFTLLVGTHNIAQEAFSARYSPEQIVVHCCYDNPLFANDVALVKTKTKIVFYENIKRIRLYSEFVPKGAKLRLTGWGATQSGDTVSEQHYPNRLQKLDFKAVSYNECMADWNDYGGVDIGSICAVNGDDKGACYGDSGGPLIYKSYLVGIASYVAPCARGFPDVFASINYHYDFIRSVIQYKDDDVGNDFFVHEDEKYQSRPTNGNHNIINVKLNRNSKNVIMNKKGKNENKRKEQTLNTQQ